MSNDLKLIYGKGEKHTCGATGEHVLLESSGPKGLAVTIGAEGPGHRDMQSRRRKRAKSKISPTLVKTYTSGCVTSVQLLNLSVFELHPVL